MNLTEEALAYLPVHSMATEIAAGRLTATRVVEACLARIARHGDSLHAFVTVYADDALRTAHAADEAMAAGHRIGPFHGIPVAVKDIVATAGLPTTCGSKILEGWIPPYDATITRHIKAAGLPILGKTNMDEFAMGSSTENSAYGPTRNPWDTDRVPGGSGGGSAAALAAFQAPLAIGANCGVGASDILVTILEMGNSSRALVSKGNCGVPQFHGTEIVYSGTPELMGKYAALAVDAGARIIGGCCGTTPDPIRAVRAVVEGRGPALAPAAAPTPRPARRRLPRPRPPGQGRRQPSARPLLPPWW